MQKYGGGFQNWKYFPRKNLGRLITHALPNNPKALSHPYPPNPNPNQPNPLPKITPTKSPQPLKFQHPSILTPNKPNPEHQNSPKPQNN